MQRDKTSQDKKNSKSKSPMLPGTSELGTELTEDELKNVSGGHTPPEPPGPC